MHSGGQYNPLPEAYTRMIVSKIKEFGADIIVGHHPHILRKSEITDGFITAFSLGNFLFAPSTSSVAREVDPAYNALLYVGICPETKKISGASFSLLKVKERAVGEAYIVNAADLSEDAEVKEALKYASPFAGRDITESAREYTLI